MQGENEQTETEPTQGTEETEQQEQIEAPEGGEETEPQEDVEGTGEEEPAEGTETEAKEGAPKEDEKRRRDGGWKRRIDRLERQNQMLLEQLAANRPQPPAAPAADAPKDPTAQVQEYVSSLVQQQLAAERAKEQQARAHADFQQRMAAVRATHPDFEEALQDVAHIPVPAETQRVLLTSEHGPAIMYQLAKNPAELARISALPPLDAAREIGRLEAKASSTPAPRVQPKAARPPAPPTSVGGSAKSTGNLDDLPLAAYKRAMRQR